MKTGDLVLSVVAIAVRKALYPGAAEVPPGLVVGELEDGRLEVMWPGSVLSIHDPVSLCPAVIEVADRRKSQKLDKWDL